MTRTTRLLRYLVLSVFTSLATGLHCSGQSDEEHAGRRAAMVAEQLQARDITDPDVLRAMATVPRHAFVPALLRRQAYDDHPLPIGSGQTISQPYIVALMTQLAELEADDVVLEIGTGSGYQAAVLSRIVERVYTVEIVPELAEDARQDLEAVGYTNVTVRTGDGYLGWEEHAPFDAILVTAAPPAIPPPLIEQLAPGATMVIPVGPQGRVQSLQRITKAEDGSTVTEEILPVVFVPLVRDPPNPDR